MRLCYRLLLAILITTSIAAAGTTGKISGRVVDDKTNEPLIGANVVIVGTSYGAATDVDGNYFINNIPPGSYTLKISAVGYNSETVEKLAVNIDLTTNLDAKLGETVLELGKEIVVTAERPLIQKDLTATTAVVGGDDIKALPVTEVSDVIGLQAGNVAGHLRGGRDGEIAYWIDGVPVTDAFDGSTVVDVNTNMVQELQVLSGAFNAEYGQAMSGIINIATRDGGEKYAGSVSAYGGDYVTSHSDIFKGVQTVNPLNIRDAEVSLSGPITGKDLTFFANARSIYFGGWERGLRDYTPHSVALVLNNQAYFVGTNRQIDSALVIANMPASQKVNQDTINKYFPGYYSALRASNANPLGDGSVVPMNWNQKLYLQGKITARLTGDLKLTGTMIMDNVDSYPYDRFYQYNPDGKGLDHRKGLTTILQLTQTLSNATYYTLGGTWFQKSFEHYLYKDPYDPRYTHPNLLNQLSNYSYLSGGTDLNRFYRATTTGLVKFDLSSQVTQEHFLKFGIEADRDRVFYENITLRPVTSQAAFTPGFSSPFITTQILPDSSIYHDRYVHNPYSLSAYAQDKMEYKDLIINIGLRVDYFEPDGVVLNDPTDPSIDAPFKPSNQFFDLNGNGVQDAGERTKTIADREKYWYKKVSAKYQISPRFGASFPITDRGVVHFSYGHFFQIPNYDQLYANPRFKVGAGTGNVDLNGAPTGNADLKPEQTINAELGLQQQLTEDLSLDLTAYVRDIRNLSGTRADQVTIGGLGGSSSYSTYVNSDFGFVRGFILSVDKRFAQGLSLTADYTFQIAKGSASSSNQTRDLLATGYQPEVQLTALDWDQRHTITGTVTYSAPSYSGSVILKYGSGTPYTPTLTTDVTTLLTNSQTKPTYFDADLRLSKSFAFDPIRFLIFLRVYNLFDIRNEVNVYGDTGRAGQTDLEQVAIQSRALPLVNSIHDYFVDPTQYSEPRRIELGATFEF